MSVRKEISLTLLCLLSVTACSDAEETPTASAPLSQQAAPMDAGTMDGGAVATSEDGGSDAAARPSLAGSAASAQCSYFNKAEGNMCSGYYCGVTEAQIAAAMPPDSACGSDPASVCKGTLVDAVSNCTRTIVTANLGAPAEQLRGQIQDCVYEDPETKANVSQSCLGCFLDAASCVVTNCLFDCVTDGAACEACRTRSNCTAPVFSCANLPSPL